MENARNSYPRRRSNADVRCLCRWRYDLSLGIGRVGAHRNKVARPSCSPCLGGVTKWEFKCALCIGIYAAPPSLKSEQQSFSLQQSSQPSPDSPLPPTLQSAVTHLLLQRVSIRGRSLSKPRTEYSRTVSASAEHEVLCMKSFVKHSATGKRTGVSSTVLPSEIRSEHKPTPTSSVLRDISACPQYRCSSAELAGFPHNND